MKRKHLTETPVCLRERLVIISYTTGLSFALERIGPLAVITIIVFYLFALYLFTLPNTLENPFASIYSESLIKTTCQRLLFLVGFDTLIYRKYYDTPPILVGHHVYVLTLLCVALLCGGHVVFYALWPSIIRLRMQRVLYNAPIFFCFLAVLPLFMVQHSSWVYY
jgi:hypothetical protein